MDSDDKPFPSNYLLNTLQSESLYKIQMHLNFGKVIQIVLIKT